MKNEKACKIGMKKTSTWLWVIAIAAIAGIVLLDLLLVPLEHVAITSVMFSSAVLIILAILLRDVRKSCDPEFLK